MKRYSGIIGGIQTTATDTELTRLKRQVDVLKHDAAKAALSLLENNGDGINDTIWLDSSAHCPTLYEHLVMMTDIEELTGDVDADKAILRAAADRIAKEQPHDKD